MVGEEKALELQRLHVEHCLGHGKLSFRFDHKDNYSGQKLTALIPDLYCTNTQFLSNAIHTGMQRGKQKQKLLHA